MKARLNLKLNPVRVHLSCLNCVKDHYIDYEQNENENEIGEIKNINMGYIVFDEFRCDGCGCNSFNTEVKCEVKMSTEKKED